MSIVDQLKQFRGVYHHSLADQLEQQALVLLKCGYAVDELVILYIVGEPPEVMPRSVTTEAKH